MRSRRSYKITNDATHAHVCVVTCAILHEFKKGETTMKRTTRNNETLTRASRDAMIANERAREIVRRRATRATIDDARNDVRRCEQCDMLTCDDTYCTNCAYVFDASRVVALLIDNNAKRVAYVHVDHE